MRKYPVGIQSFFSKSNLTSIEKLDEYIDFTLSTYEQQYNIAPSKVGTSIRMTNIIHAAERKMGKKVVVLVDEYDNMMLHSLGDAPMQKLVRERFQDLFTPLKGEDDHLQFVFITGISKFSPKGIYIIELKYNTSADNALRQIEERGYASKYALERQRVGDGTSGIGRPIIKVGLAFSSKERNITEWKSKED